jgi:hypothetical protein
VYLSSKEYSDYDGVFRAIEDLGFRNVDIKSLSQEGTVYALGRVQTSVHMIKRVYASLHVLNLYLIHYRGHTLDSGKQRKIIQYGLTDIYDEQHISHEFGPFFLRLFKPFQVEFVEARITRAWKEITKKKRFEQNLKKDKNNESYWRDFNSFWVDYMGKKMDQMMKAWWKNFKNYTKPRWSKSK